MIDEWTDIFARMRYGIYVLTSAHERQIGGMIASWVSQISFEPALVATAVHPNRFTHHLIEQSGAFGLHLVGKHQRDFLGRFKGDDPRARFDSLKWKRAPSGVPLIEDCIAWLECEVRESLQPGNHTLFIGEVASAGLQSDRPVLTTGDYDGVYLGAH